MKSKSLSLPSKDDTVIYTLKPEGDWHEAKVTGRGGKAMGLHSSWFNVKSTTSDKQYSIDFENVIGNFVIIPKSCHIHMWQSKTKWTWKTQKFQCLYRSNWWRAI